MENVDTNETFTEVSKAEIATEQMNDNWHHSSEKSVESLTRISGSNDFIENEERTIDENRLLANLSQLNLVKPNNLDSVRVMNDSDLDPSTHLINAESTSSSFNGQSAIKSSDLNNEDVKSSTPIQMKSDDDTCVSANNTSRNDLDPDKGNLGESSDRETHENSIVTAANESESKENNSTSLKSDHVKTENSNLGETYIPDAGESSSEANKDPEEEWMDILGSGHLLKKVLTPGIPNSRPQKSDICVLNVVGRLEDDGTIVEQHENLEINHSDNEVIQGLDFALALMDKGEVAEIKITPRFGYGSLGKRPEIPPGANLIYTVTLLDVKEEPSIPSLNVLDRIKIGLKKKERGNWWYSRDENTLAINCYRRALDYLDDTDIGEPHTEEELHKLLEERLKTYNNLGAAQMKVSAFDAALMSVNNVLAAQPENVKALFRKAKILKEKGELQESINVIKQALSHEPESQTLQQELSLLMAAQRKVNSKQRELYKKMMGNSSNQPDEESKKKNSKNNYKTFTLVAAVSFAVALLGTIVVKYKF